MSTVAKTAPRPSVSKDERLARLHQQTSKLSLFEFWAETRGEGEHAATDRLMPDAKAQPHIWRYRDIHPCLLEAAELIPLEMSERRSLIMMNPSLRPAPATVKSLMAAYRINIPNEIAPVHRHSPNAIRFGLTGNSNFTSVNGEQITFGPGDLVLTPHDTWHNHGNGPDEASVNLSVLDLPLVNFLNATYFQFDYAEEKQGELVKQRVQSARVPAGYSQGMYGTGGLLPRHISHTRGAGTSSPMFVYGWEQTERLINRLRHHDSSPYEGALVEYINPVTGGPVYRTMAFFIQFVLAGGRLLPMRQSANQIFTVFKGRGTTMIGEESFSWEPYDTFCIPAGEWYQHAAVKGEDAVLFVSSDEPTLRALGFLLKHGRNQQGDVVVLESSVRST